MCELHRHHARGAADRVFVRDLASTVHAALRIAAGSETAQALAERSAQEARLRRLSAFASGVELGEASDASTSTLTTISQQQLLLGRIEASSGQDDKLRALARTVERVERLHMARW